MAEHKFPIESYINLVGDGYRYFYHYGYYLSKDQNSDSWVTTNKLIEITRKQYFEDILPQEKYLMSRLGKPWHRPCRYHKDQIPSNKELMKQLNIT